MTPAEARAAIETAFVAAWAGRLPISHDNDFGGTPSTPWARITVLHTDGRLQSWSGTSRHWENSGRVIVQVYVPPGVGVKAAYDHVPAIRAALEGKRLVAVQMGAATVRDIGTDDTGWWSLQVSLPFWYEHTSVP